VVRGELGTYRIHVPWGGVLRLADSGFRQLNIPQKLLDDVSLNLAAFPIDLDYRTEMILRKAHSWPTIGKLSPRISSAS
jgi:hypothetical protein